MPYENPEAYDRLSTPELKNVLEERVETLVGKFGQAVDAGQSGELSPPGGEAPVPPELEEPTAAGNSPEEALGGILAGGATDPADIIAALREQGFEITRSSLPGEGAEPTPEEAIAGGELPEEPEAPEEEEGGVPPMVKARRKAAKNASEKAEKGGEAA